MSTHPVVNILLKTSWCREFIKWLKCFSLLKWRKYQLRNQHSVTQPQKLLTEFNYDQNSSK